MDPSFNYRMVEYQTEKDLTPDDFLKVLFDSGLAERRPIEDYGRISQMLHQADIIITARIHGEIIGVARSLSDFVYATYLSDLAVSKNHQRSGIGRELIHQTRAIAPQAKLILLSAPAAMDYYPYIGFQKHQGCYFLDGI